MINIIIVIIINIYYCSICWCVSEGSKLSCPMCSKTFSHAKLLTLHLRSHTQTKPFPCSVCQKRFSRKQGLFFNTTGYDINFLSPAVDWALKAKYLSMYLSCSFSLHAGIVSVGAQTPAKGRGGGDVLLRIC